MAFPSVPTSLAPYTLWVTPDQQGVLIYRRESGEFQVTSYQARHTPLFSYVNTSDPDIATTYAGLAQWTPVKFREVNPRVRRYLFPRVGSGRLSSTPWQLANNPVTTYKGKQFNAYQPHPFKQWRDKVRSWGPIISEALKEWADCNWRDHNRIADELADKANETSYGREQFVGAIRDAFAQAGHDEPIQLCDCGHAENMDDSTSDHAGNSYCGMCAEDLREIDGEYYTQDECYYWESDGEYHTESEPEEDDDEYNDRPSSQYVQSWGTPANDYALNHDKSFMDDNPGDFTMGVELEVECGHSSDYADAVSGCHQHFNTNSRYAMFKKDGSLSESGFEIVTAARGLKYHLEMFSTWEPHSSLRAWSPGTCGVHVHIDSKAFTGLTLGKFLMFINVDSNKAFIKSIAGRHPTDGGSAGNYCRQLGDNSVADPVKAIKSSADREVGSSRYRMVNLCNLTRNETERLKVEGVQRACKGDYSTVELRIFRASLKKERLLAQVEFSHAAVMFCRVASYHQLTGDAFKTWLEKRADYKNLSRWFNLRVPKVDKRPTAAKKVVLEEEVYA